MKKRYWIGGLSASALAASVAAKLLLRPGDVEWDKNRDVVFNADYSRFTEVDGVRVHYQEAGQSDAPAMILIHGFAASNLVWSKVFLEFAAGRLQSDRAGSSGLWLFGQASQPRLHNPTPGRNGC